MNLTDEEKDAKATVIKMLADPIYEKFLNARSVPVLTKKCPNSHHEYVYYHS